ncbi:MAG: carbohydrate kinase family protein [Anaerolineales bacterium]|nr:carbohydrate kinase family protein [Anaerolineales bacterium]
MSTSLDCDVLVFGDYFLDLVITGLPDIPRLGADVFGTALEMSPGGAYILTTALHRLGVRVCWAARLGNDLFSRFVLEEAQKEGLDTSLFEFLPAPYRSLSISFSFASDRGFISYIDPAPPGMPPEESIRRARPRWVVNLPFDGAEESRCLIRLVHDLGGRVYTDCQYTTQTLNNPGLVETLSMIDVFAPNLSEARQLTGAADAETAAEILARYVPLVVIKCGGEGALARAGGEVWNSPALPVQVADTTGAGDCFNAGFLYGLLRGDSIETCLRYGNICGGLSVTQVGGVRGAPTLEQLQSYLQEDMA